jgi:hypothetical protein
LLAAQVPRYLRDELGAFEAVGWRRTCIWLVREWLGHDASRSRCRHPCRSIRPMESRFLPHPSASFQRNAVLLRRSVVAGRQKLTLEVS